MELVKARGRRRKGYVRRDALAQLCDVGARLEYVLSRYARMARDLGEMSVNVPDLSDQVELVNSQLAVVAGRLQDMLILEHDAARADALAAREAAAARRNAFPRRIRALA
jgi:hypothetical protein